MNPPRKIRVAVLYGGRSGEHEVSLQSAANVIRQLDRDRYEVVPVSIDKEGKWRAGDLKLLEGQKSLPVFKNVPDVFLPPRPALNSESRSLVSTASSGSPGAAMTAFDVIFPVMHGPLCEDGTIQGLLELADVPYVGCGVLASAVGMDKDFSKRIALGSGIPTAPYLVFRKSDVPSKLDFIIQEVTKKIGFPVFVKPCNMGSSVGIHKVKRAEELGAALMDAFQYDLKVMIEKGLEVREIELAVLENATPGEEPRVSIAGEIVPQHEFYSYEAKYMDENGALLELPAKLSSEQMKEAQRLAREIFVALECEGMARVDLFLEKSTGKFYFNEVNTIPGFTSISMYPKMWEASGIGHKDLLTELVELAISRHERKSRLKREFHSG